MAYSNACTCMAGVNRDDLGGNNVHIASQAFR